MQFKYQRIRSATATTKYEKQTFVLPHCCCTELYPFLRRPKRPQPLECLQLQRTFAFPLVKIHLRLECHRSGVRCRLTSIELTFSSCKCCEEFAKKARVILRLRKHRRKKFRKSCKSGRGHWHVGVTTRQMWNCGAKIALCVCSTSVLEQGRN